MTDITINMFSFACPLNQMEFISAALYSAATHEMFIDFRLFTTAVVFVFLNRLMCDILCIFLMVFFFIVFKLIFISEQWPCHINS